MDTSTYIDVKACAKSVNDVHARVLQAVHFCNWNGMDLGLSFSKFQEDVPNEFGDTMRVFGSTTELYEFYAKLRECVKQSEVVITEVAKTPETTTYVSFIRDRAIERSSPSNVKRRIARAKARGETYVPKKIEAVNHTLVVPSVSSGKFVLNVKKTNAPFSGGSQYGLGKLVPCF